MSFPAKTPLQAANDALALRRFSADRRMLCQLLGIVDDETADLPLLVANIMAKQRRLDDLLRSVARRVSASDSASELGDVVAACEREVSRA